VNPRQQLSECAFARAVFTAERMAGSRRNLERDAIERDDAGKTLGDAVETDCGCR
jgi:hypothetical protein